MRHRELPPFGEAERVAWGAVLGAIESAMDVDGLGHFDRASLAELYERAAWHIGVPALAIPGEWAGAMNWDLARAPGGIYELGRFGVDADTLAVLAHHGRILPIDDVKRHTDAELLGIRRIGPKRPTAIRDAVKRCRAQPDA
jgi:hypothetical protein